MSYFLPKHFSFLLTGWLFLCSAPLQARPQSLQPLSIQLEKAKKQYGKGNCDKVIELLKHAPQRESIEDDDVLVEIESLLAQCYFQKGDKENAERELKNLLFLRPNFSMDPFQTPPELLKLFDERKKELNEKVKELEDAKQNASEKIEIIEHTVYFKRTSPFSAFVPFGFGQFENGHTVKGIAIASLEGALIALNVSAYWYKRSLVLEDSMSLVMDENAKNNYNVAQSIQFAALGGLAGVYVLGVTDALVFRSETIQESEVTKLQRVTKEEFLQKLQDAKVQKRTDTR